MRKLIDLRLDKFRLKSPPSREGENYGAFLVQTPFRTILLVISSGSTRNGDSREGQWEHVSVSLPDRCPTWDEMNFVKDLFWSGSETVLQFHPAKFQYVNTHPFCLHLWKPPTLVELPPISCV